ncbi:protein ArgJ, mitochondrial [Seminavis robusta]|uniref:Arginine biosynthesis bifunctional protein ArgJ, mitochondrial n=1 Tax=Seminavis robusta TaxID=568900 RepID=A0A9N8HD66_9STRA|nr:protein ArgJ, mitochondrial [Seminavis robusta]|eukprot:Sro347_g123090.1 protein ArgJ, mitochondrial (488) ;mRNA; r:69784-71247
MMSKILLFSALLASQTNAFVVAPQHSSRPLLIRGETRQNAATEVSQDTPATLPAFENKEAYMEYMEGVSALPKGFATGTAKGTFISVEAPAMGALPIKGTVIHLTEEATENWAAVFTSNKFPGAPVIVGRQRLADGGPLHALVINNKVSNVCSGGDGVGDSEMVCKAVADALQLEGGAKTVLPSSTGVIGWRLPAEALSNEVVPAAVKNMDSVSGLDAAAAIMTTDRWPKLRSKTLSNGARLVGIAKGAGMIEPNMATMLSYLMTDATIPKAKMQAMLSKVTNQSYNSISVDGDESTSDTVVMVGSNQVDNTDEAEFEAALLEICQGLAADIVRNGEGTGHVMRVEISNFPGSELEARRLGRHIVNSPLFKCAVSGNDPNTGRLAGAIGSFMGKYKTDGAVDKMTLTLGGRVIFDNGKFVLEGDSVEKELSDHMADAQYNEHSDYPPHQKCVEIGVDFGAGTGDASATVLGSDLTGEYVVVNADYRS